MNSTAYARLLGGAEIRGGSNDRAHRGWLDVSSFQVAGAKIPLGNGGGTSRAGATPQEVLLMMEDGPWTTALMVASAQGTHFDSAELEVYPSAGGDGSLALKLTLSDVFISSFYTNSSGTACTLNFKTLDRAYLAGPTVPTTP